MGTRFLCLLFLSRIIDNTSYHDFFGITTFDHKAGKLKEFLKKVGIIFCNRHQFLVFETDNISLKVGITFFSECVKSAILLKNEFSHFAFLNKSSIFNGLSKRLSRLFTAIASLEEFINDPIIKEGIEAGGTLEEIDDYNDLQDKIRDIRAKAIDLGEISPYMQEIKEKIENYYAKSEEGYKDLLPSLYYDYKKYYIRSKLEFMDFTNDFLENYEEIYEGANVDNVLSLCKSVEDYFNISGNYTKGNGELATNEEIYELRNAIQQIEKRKYIKENAYKETKIVVEPYNDRIMVYLEGEVKPREFNKLEQRMKDGQNSYKNGHIEKGLVKEVEKGNFAIVSVLQQLKVETGKDFLEGYTHMFAKNPEVASKINSVVYDFSNENGKIQSQKMIKEMKKYAKYAEKYGVAESIGRKEGIAEKAKDGIAGFFGKGKEK